MLNNFAFAFFGQVFGHHKHLTGANRQIHCAADRRDCPRCAGTPVGQIAAFGNLIGAEHADIQVTAAHHGKRVAVMEKAAAFEQGNRLFTGVDQFGIFLAGRRCRAHTENAVFAVQEDLFIRRQEVGYLGWDPNAQVDVGTFRDIAGNTFGQLLMCKFGHGGAP
ncbi:hypothetical protein D3C75_1016670 [compost metagenome]